MKVLAIGDLHFKVKNARQVEQACEQLITIANDSKPDIIVLLGDTLDTHERINVYPLTRAIKFLYSLSEIAPTYSLVGNHDRPNNEDFLSDYHPFVGIGNDRLIIVDKVVTTNDFIFVPYVPNGQFKNAINTKVPTKQINDYKAIFAHQEFRNAKMGAIESINGDTWPCDNISVITGHIHDYQIISACDCGKDDTSTNIYYPGTPIQHSFAEQRKSVSLFTFGDQLTEERITLNVKLRRTYRINAEQFEQFEPSDEYINKLVVDLDNDQHSKTLRKSNHYQYLLSRNVTIHFKLKVKEQSIKVQRNFEQTVDALIVNQNSLLRERWLKLKHEF